MSISLAYKIRTFPTSPHWLYIYSAPIILCILALVDLFRLRMGYAGNLQERIPELSGLVILTVFPQLVICAYFGGIQRLFITILPMEYALNGVYIVILVVEFICAWAEVQRVISAQAPVFLYRGGMPEFAQMQQQQSPTQPPAIDTASDTLKRDRPAVQ
eukprot:Partr_v1_DN28121_c2_g1_i1_m55417